jgi:hypothetical protein
MGLRKSALSLPPTTNSKQQAKIPISAEPAQSAVGRMLEGRSDAYVPVLAGDTKHPSLDCRRRLCRSDAPRSPHDFCSSAPWGCDVASIDYGRSKDFKVHRITAAGNVPGLENLTRLEELPTCGATVIALPMKIEGGSGGPVRVIALVPQADSK